MPLFEYHCLSCKNRFEQIVGKVDDPDAGTCPKCGKPGAQRQIAKFRVGGRGDLRETTDYHGCHSALDADHDHGHDHGDGE